MSLYFIPLIMIIIFGAYYIFVIPKIKQKSEEGMQALRDSLKGKEGELQKKYLEDPNYLKPVLDVLNGEKIEGVVNCLEKRSVTQVLKQKIVNDISNAFEDKLGINFAIKDNQDTYYLVLTEEKLHYMVFDQSKIKEHLTFDFLGMTKTELERANISDAMFKGGQQRYQKLNFEYEGKKHTFFFTEGVFYLPNKGFVGNVMAEWIIIFGEAFKKNLQRRLGLPET